MKHFVRFFLGVAFLLTILISANSCKKDKVELVNNAFDSTGYTRLFTRTFESDAHTTSGNLLIYGNGTNIAYVFKNFKTDDGPNLEVWLSNSTSNPITSGYTNLGALKGIEGNFYYITPSSTSSFSYLLIWCTDFSVLFGHTFTI